MILKKDLIHQIMKLIDHCLVIGLMKDKLRGKIMAQLAVFRPKTHSYLMNNGNNDKKAKETKTCVITRMLKFNDYKDYIFNNEIILKSQERYKSERQKHILKKLIRRPS